MAYASSASNLVCKPACDKNGTLDIYLYDPDKRINTRISQGIKGESNGPSYTPSVSHDGNRVVFISDRSSSVARIKAVAGLPGREHKKPHHIGDGGQNHAARQVAGLVRTSSSSPAGPRTIR